MPPTYTKEQVEQYLSRIGFPRDAHPQNPLERLTELHKRHRSRVPFEDLDLHYTNARLLSLDPETLFHKIVGRGRGGYCMEVGTFFATILRSLGYTVLTVGARVKKGESFMGWNHMALLVTIDGQKYLCDVGFGANSPPLPIPLIHGQEQVGIAPYLVRLEFKNVSQHTDSGQKLWVYCYEGEDREWHEGYAFTELEFFPDDYRVMNLDTMTSPRSFFVQTVVVQRTIFDEEKRDTVGLMILHKDYVKQRIGDKVDFLETLNTEAERAAALEKYFGIVLTGEERKAIGGLASALQG